MLKKSHQILPGRQGELMSIARRLQETGRIVAIVTIFNMVNFVAGYLLRFFVDMAGVPRIPMNMAQLLSMTVLFCVLFTAFSILLLIKHESLRKNGETLFEEISEEYEWGEDRRGAVRPDFDIRVALRSFTRSIDLPLVPGKLASAVYALLNIGIVVLALSQYRFR